MRPSRPIAFAESVGEHAISWSTATRARPGSCPLSRSLYEIRAACGPFEWLTLAYLAWLNAVVLLFHRRISLASGYFALHVATAFAIACLVRSAARSRSSVLRFLRHWYPLPLYIFFFEELGGLVHAVFPGWFDAWLIRFDYALARVHPSVWLAQFASPALNDFMQFAYMTYFLYLIILPAILYVQRDRAAFWTVMVSTAVAHYSVYVLSVLLPVESPYYSLAVLQPQNLPGGYCTALIDLIERFGRVRGAAFPSAHVAGSTVAILASWRYRRWLFWICLPFFAAMCVATVYGRYHYVADVLAGLLVGALGFSAGSFLMSRSAAHPQARDRRPRQWISF